MTRTLVGLAAVAVALVLIWSTIVMTTPTPERPVITVKTHILDSVHDYLRNNDLAANEQRFRDRATPDDFPADYIVARAGDRHTDDPGGVILTYDAGSCPITLPAGRQFAFSYIGGYLDNIDAIFPLEPMPWDEMQEMVAQVTAQFDAAGWRADGDRPALTPEQFLKGGPGTKWARVGHWRACDAPFVTAYVQVRHYNSSAPGSFTPPAGLTAPLPDDAPDRFLMRIWFYIKDKPEVEAELTALRNARRVDASGKATQALPVSVWIDDPNWRPEDWSGTYID
ncbi:hypothetical protein [Actibacterium sp. 188UL27-1]|uniref:hypothetical protein n=1 Tax=Actibacterium sp. 188UL27-1 TaxID=2786961 RepID=UPI0019566D4D|nr:hypothetical protein [Actibacterium sp. 188UL27-1]MBM7066542.1 hypothetical protein [Actibacterium sp. 188UL27-1]